MNRRSRLAVLIIITLAVAGGEARPDLIKLKNGGEIRGKLDRKTGRSLKDDVTIKTLYGAVVVVGRKHIEFITRRSLIVEEYETRAKQTPETVKAHWQLAEWCRLNRLKKQRAQCLRRIIELDPEHEKAHYGLGHAKRGGQWMTRDAAMKAQGYVKHKGRYVTPQELELIEKNQAELQRERAWSKKVRLWRGWLTGRDAKRNRRGLAALQNIQDPDAVSALVRNFSDDSDKRIRSLHVSILSQIPGPKPVSALVNQSLHDSDYEIRYHALNGLAPKQYETATPLYLRELKNTLNPIVRRAAVALERVGDERSVPNLIDALVTTHRYRIRVPDKSGALHFGTDGSFSGTGGGRVVIPPEVEVLMRTGQLPYGVIVNQAQPPMLPKRSKIVTIKYDHKNSEVLSALKKFTGKSFGYDKRTWRLWWAAEKAGTGKTS